jgi:multidrug efflux pump subunit AcrA (membrane-fusion protein)
LLVGLFLAGLGLRHRYQTVETDGLTTDLVRYEPLKPTIQTRGYLQPAQASEIFCRVRNAPGATSATTIRWVIEEGTEVKRGQVLLELDDSGLEEDVQTRRIWRDQAWALWQQAEANYQITLRQNEGDVRKAQVDVELAALELEKYRRGDYEQARKDLEGKLLLAEADVNAWSDRLAWTERQVRKGYVGATQARAEEARLQSATVTLQRLREEYRVLHKYAHPRSLIELQGKLEESQALLAKARSQAKALQIAANTDRLSKQRIYRRRDQRCREQEAEIQKCILTAPRDGLVIYEISNQSRSRSGSRQAIIAQGEPVSYGQRLLVLPDLSKMVVNVRIHEALVGRVYGDTWEPTGFRQGVRASLLTLPSLTTRLAGSAAYLSLSEEFLDRERRLVRSGLPALIRIDAVPNRVFQGHVQEVGLMPAQNDSRHDTLSMYEAIVSLDENVQGLRPDMNAEVTIQLDSSLAPVLTVPVEALVGTPDMGPRRRCYVVTPEGLEERDVLVGESTEYVAEVRSGLSEGEEIVTNPKSVWSELAAKELDSPRAGVTLETD